MSKLLQIAYSLFCVAALHECIQAQPGMLPQPRRFVDDECLTFSASRLERLLENLKSERDALDADLKTMGKKDPAPKLFDDKIERGLEKQLKDALDRLKHEKAKSEKPTIPDPPWPKIVVPPPPEEKKKTTPIEKPIEEPVSTDVTPSGIDPVVVGQTLLRAEQYQNALDAFRQVDLKGKKAEERAPIQFMMALCLMQIGKTDEALTLFREVANSRGDERMANHAQWQLDMHRWQREVRDRVQDVRQRRQALEKRP